LGIVQNSENPENLNSIEQLSNFENLDLLGRNRYKLINLIIKSVFEIMLLK
jgi:hypothetical protein